MQDYLSFYGLKVNCSHEEAERFSNAGATMYRTFDMLEKQLKTSNFSGMMARNFLIGKDPDISLSVCIENKNIHIGLYKTEEQKLLDHCELEDIEKVNAYIMLNIQKSFENYIEMDKTKLEIYKQPNLTQKWAEKIPDYKNTIDKDKENTGEEFFSISFAERCRRAQQKAEEHKRQNRPKTVWTMERSGGR